MAQSSSITFTQTDAAALVPETNLTTRLSSGLSYDSTTSGEFPDSGVRASVGAAYSFGRQGDAPLNWTTLNGGASTYYGFGRTIEKDLESAKAAVDAAAAQMSQPDAAPFDLLCPLRQLRAVSLGLKAPNVIARPEGPGYMSPRINQAL